MARDSHYIYIMHLTNMAASLKCMFTKHFIFMLQGEVKFKLYFKSGGAIDFGTAMLKAAQLGNVSLFISA